MHKIKATKMQIVASVLIVVLAVVAGGIGLYGLKARSGEMGDKLLQEMRLQSILNTAGSGAVDAYVAAEKSSAIAKVRKDGGGMAEVREASAKAEEEARQKAADLGIGTVNLSAIDTEPLEGAVVQLLDAQRAYFKEEKAAQDAYAATLETAQPEAVPAETADPDAEPAAEDEMFAEEKVDLSGFEATEEMKHLQVNVDEAYSALCEALTVSFPTLTEDVLASLKPIFMDIVCRQGDTFETQYDRLTEGSGMKPGFNGFMMRQGRTMTITAVGLVILALAVLFYVPLVVRMGVPRLIISLFFILLCLLAIALDLSLPSQLSNTLVRLGMNGVLVLAMLPGIQCGISLNLGLPIGIIGGLLGGLLCIELGLHGFVGLLFAIVVGLAISAGTGYLYGVLLNRLKGEEMSVTTYVGFSVVSLMCIAWLVLPFTSPVMKWPLGKGLRTTIGLQSAYKHVLNDFLAFDLFGIHVPTGLLLFFGLCCLLVWLFMRSKTGIAMSAAGANPRFAAATGINVDRMRIIGTMLSTMIAAVGIIVYGQSYGFMQLYQAPRQMGFLAAAAILLGGATTTRAKISHVIIGTFLFQGILTLGMPVANALVSQSTISETLRILISNGIILYALTKSGGASRE